MKALLPYQVAGLLARLLPRRAAYAVAGQASNWAYAYNRAVREALETNIRVVLDYKGIDGSESDLKRIVRRNFHNFGKYLVDFFKIGRLSTEALAGMIEVENIDYVRQCREMGKGVIGLSAHVGNWELGAIVLGSHGFQVNAVVRVQPTEKLDALFQSRRILRGIRVLPMSGTAASVPACLKRNEFVAILADIDFSGREHHVPFFGRPARLPRGPAVLAARYEVPMLPVFVLRQPDETFRFRVYPPILPDRSRSIEETRKRIGSVMEEVIGEHPEQWFAFEKLWDSPAEIQPGNLPSVERLET